MGMPLQTTVPGCVVGVGVCTHKAPSSLMMMRTKMMTMTMTAKMVTGRKSRGLWAWPRTGARQLLLARVVVVRRRRRRPSLTGGASTPEADRVNRCLLKL